MAYAALVSLEQTIDQILNQARYSTSTQEKHHLASLDRYVISFQAFLEGFPDKAKKFEARIRDAATAAEDILECFMLDQVQSDRRRWIDEVAAGSKLKYQLNRVAKKMEAIATEVMAIKKSIMIKDEKLGDSSILISSSSTVFPAGKIDVVGIDDDLFEIKDRLAGRSPQLQHLAISGMGGIGKTTLARNAYDDQLIKEHFDIRAWVTISQDYSAQEILSCLLDSMRELNPNGSKGMSVAEMADRIYKILYGRRYLIVMDDVWSTEVLDDVRNLFPDDCNGSRIMLTTRQSDVASYASSSPYEMRLMDEKKSWDLLKQKIGRALLSDELEIIGHEIARSCRGLPLAVVVIAGILSSVSETPASWAEVSKNIKKAASKDERMEEVVSLGYNHLPHRLKACLLYMGLLPEDYSIRVSLLVKLWIAEGFLKHPDDDSSKSLEAYAEEHLEDLVRRNLILVTGRKYNGKIKSCGLHDMVRETCIRLLNEEKHLRHIVTTEEDNQGCISKRSVLCFSHDYDGMVRPSFLKRFRLLRVLHVPRNEYNILKELNLYHLRHLCFFHNELYFFHYELDLPADLSYFENLQSFIFTHVIDIQLPPSIWKLRQLRHIIVNLGFLPDPNAISALENLQTLKRVVFDEKIIKSLERVPNLRKLGLYLHSEYSELHLNESLVCLRQLEQLKISSRSGYQYPNHLSAVFPESLKKLTQKFGRTSVSYLEAIGSLPNLQELQLWCCGFENAAWEVRGGEFPKLEMLHLRELYLITTFIVEDAAFPMLSCLRIHLCSNLEELSDEIGDIPTLQLIQVSRSSKGVCEWARRVKESQQDLGNDTLQASNKSDQTPIIGFAQVNDADNLQSGGADYLTSKYGQNMQRLSS